MVPTNIGKNGILSDFKFPYQGAGKKMSAEEYYQIDYAGKDLHLEKIYLPNSINNIRTKTLIKTLISRFKKKIIK